MSRLRTKSIRTMFHAYADENCRINKDDAAITKRLIREELQSRLNKALVLLDTAMTDADAEQIYKQFVEH